MAERRMFNKAVMFSDLFTRLHHNAKLLYIYINLHADDDGICGNSQALARMYGCSKSHIQTLIDGGWLLPFDTGEVAVAHWHLHNQIRKDRYRPSICTHVTKQLKKGADGVYTIAEPGCQDDNQPVVNLSTTVATQDSIGQDSIGQDSIGQDSIGQKSIEKVIFNQSSGPQAAGDDPEIDFEKILSDYQVLCSQMLPCTELTEPLREKIREVFRQGYNKYTFVNLFSKAAMSDYLRGKNPQNWRAGMDWLLEPTHMYAVLDGKYDNWRRTSQ